MRKNPIIAYLVYGIVLPASVFLFASICRNPAPDQPVHRKSQLLMGTVVEISVAGPISSAKAAAAIDKAFAEVRRIEAKFSTFREGNAISRINNLKKGESLAIDDETFFIIGESVRYATLTEGTFDITVKPLLDLWGFSSHHNRVPETAKVADVLRRVGIDRLVLDRNRKTITFSEDGMKIDLGGIAKGYATDRAIAVLCANGVRNAVVNSGGDIYCLGERSSGKAWKVGIQDPAVRNRVAGELLIRDAAVDTSGNYERFFRSGARTYCHIVDPRTGMPVSSPPFGATVIATSSMEADALATALVVLGPEHAEAMMESFPDTAFILVREPEGKARETFTSRNIERHYASDQ